MADLNPAQAGRLRALRRHWWEEAHGDEDLGSADMATLLKQSGTFEDLDPDTVKLLQELLPQLTGGQLGP